MKIRIAVVLFCTTSCSFSVRAQEANLIRNGSFEAYSTCPFDQSSGIWLVDYWGQRGSVDYFNVCANEMYPDYGVPINFFGIQPSRSGNAYASFWTYGLNILIREFAWTQFSEPLSEGTEYRLEFFVSRADSSNFASSNIGGYISIENTLNLGSTFAFFNLTPQVESDSLIPIVDSDGWVRVSGTFVAQGGEQYLTIGNFRDDDEIDSIVRVASHLPLQRWDGASYYLDDVSLIPVDSLTSVIEIERVKVNVYPNPATNILTVEVALNGDRIFELLDIQGRVVLQQSMETARRHVDVSHLPAGVYVAVLRQEGVAVARRKVVIQK